MNHGKAMVLGLMTVVLGVAIGCNAKPAERSGERGSRTISKANIATFDPDEDIHFDLNAYGTSRPDQYAIEQAFAGAYPGMDTCVADEKARKKSEKQLPGEAKFAIKLNPKESRPFAVNAELEQGLSPKLNDCLREAVAGVTYPTYDGPPTVVKFTTELDPGYAEE